MTEFPEKLCQLKEELGKMLRSSCLALNTSSQERGQGKIEQDVPLLGNTDTSFLSQGRVTGDFFDSTGLC